MKTLTLFAFTGIIFLGILLNSCKHEPILPPGPDVSFKNDIQKTISTKCTFACHTGNGEEPLLLEYNDIFPRYVTIYKPLESKLYKVITSHSSLNIMPPKSYEPVTRSQIDEISIWILQGAKDN